MSICSDSLWLPVVVPQSGNQEISDPDAETVDAEMARIFIELAVDGSSGVFQRAQFLSDRDRLKDGANSDLIGVSEDRAVGHRIPHFAYGVLELQAIRHSLQLRATSSQRIKTCGRFGCSIRLHEPPLTLYTRR